MAVAGNMLAGLVSSPEWTPPNVTGVGPLAPLHIVGGKTAGDAPGPLEKRYNERTGGVTGAVSTSKRTVFDGRESVCPPTVHSATAVLLIVCDPLCANAGKLAAGRSIPAASTPALFTIILVNDFISEKGGSGRPARRPLSS